jgi:hypothetical protein
MAYVDLNPVRAGMASTLEEADFTSVQARLTSLCEDGATPRQCTTGVPLLPFSRIGASPDIVTLPFRLTDYLELVAATGRRIVEGKPDTIPDHVPHLLELLGLSSAQWDTLSLAVHGSHLKAIGSLDKLRSFSRATGRIRTIGSGVLKQVYGT